MPNAYIGTSGWAYSAWKPKFYPPKLPAAKFLTHYATRLNSVEVNYTFRNLPTDRLLNGWIDATPAGFKFAIKAHQDITHRKRLRGAADLASSFAASLEPLEKSGRLGVVLFQLPPFLKCDVLLLSDFLAGLPRRLLVTFEFRHASWFVDQVFDALRERNAALCYAESDDLESPRVQTANFFYLRLRKSKYSAAALGKVKRDVAELCRQGEVHAYFKHEETPESVLRADSLFRAVHRKHKSN
jgi:uncharacterized protein YecE (DUF72 family)